ncbi:MAG: DUF1801 domain-containing protein [Paracoccaceae bacterium]
MTYEAKTRQGGDVVAFIEAIAPPERRAEARVLRDLFGKTTGFPARMWGPSIVGFGRYAYRYESGHAGEAAATGFSPRKAEISIYIMPGYQDYSAILSRLGPHRLGKACLYIRRLDRIDTGVLGELIRAGLADLGKLWPVLPE